MLPLLFSGRDVRSCPSVTQGPVHFALLENKIALVKRYAKLLRVAKETQTNGHLSPGNGNKLRVPEKRDLVQALADFDPFTQVLNGKIGNQFAGAVEPK